MPSETYHMKQNTDESMNIRKEVKSSHKKAPKNEANEQRKFSNSLESQEDQTSNWSCRVTHSTITKIRIMWYLNIVYVLEN